MPASNRYASLQNIKHPTLVVHGNKDIVVLPINAFILAEHLPNSQLIMYPDASHGAQYQHADLFLEHAKLFLTLCFLFILGRIAMTMVDAWVAPTAKRNWCGSRWSSGRRG